MKDIVAEPKVQKIESTQEVVSTKNCPKCGDSMSPMHSTDTKMCHSCGTEIPWPLTSGQTKTF